MNSFARSLVVALATLLFLPTRYAQANPLGMYGLGSRSTAMGGSVSAEVEDFSASYYNPAGLVRGRSMRLELGYLYATHALYSNGFDNHVDPVHGIVGGIVAPGALFRIPFAFGLALHLPDDRISRSRSLPQMQPRWELYDNRVQILYIAANLAVAITPWLRIGGGLAFVSSTRGSLDIYGQIAYPSASSSELRHTVDADLTAVRYPQGGVQIDVLPNLSFSAVYRGEYSIRLEIDARVEGAVVVGRPSDPNATRIPGSYALSSNSVAVFQPQQGVVGASWRPRNDITLDADLTWTDWRSYVNPTADLSTNLSLMIPPGLSAFMLPATPRPVTPVPARFFDTVTPRVGVEWRRPVSIHTLALRGGYRYDPTPVPDQSLPATNFFDCNRHAISAGVGFALRGLRPMLQGALSLDVHAEIQLLEPRTILKLDPADPVGDSAIGGHVFNMGATLAAAF